MIPEEGLESIDRLIQEPEKAFSSDVIERLGEFKGKPLDDFKESARCLAFGFHTACGFHVMRSAEAVLRKWHSLVRRDAPFETQWSNCVQELKSYNEKEKDPEVKKRVAASLNMLDSLRDANRNPLMHPEISLDYGQATSLFRLATSLMSSMVREIDGLAKGIDD